MTVADILPLDYEIPGFPNPRLQVIAERILAAREKGAAVILMMGAHVIRRGNSRFIIDLMQRGILTHVAMNGAGAIHDFELAHMGATTESVPRYIKTGQFGMWQETGALNRLAIEAAESGMGLGEAFGKAIEQSGQPHREVSLLAAGFRLQVPVTIHVSIGQDIVHQHPNCDGAAWGAASYTDFLIFAESVRNLEGGVLLNFGSAV